MDKKVSHNDLESTKYSELTEEMPLYTMWMTFIYWKCFETKKKNESITKHTHGCMIFASASILCEGFFSIAEYGLSDRRHRILSANFEMQMYLRRSHGFRVWKMSITYWLNKNQRISADVEWTKRTVQAW